MGNPLVQIALPEFRSQLERLFLEWSEERAPDSPPQKYQEETGRNGASDEQEGSLENISLSSPSSELVEALWIHHQELCRWNPRLSLIGPGTREEVIRRHYWESLVGVSFLKGTDKVIVDVGAGGGFPGWILSAAVPNLEVLLVEPREKKCAFLRAVVRKAGLLSCRVVNARVAAPLSPSLGLPGPIDVVTSRALAIPAETLEAIASHSPQARFLFWVGKEEIEIPGDYRISRSQRLAGSDHRRIIELTRAR